MVHYLATHPTTNIQYGNIINNLEVDRINHFPSLLAFNTKRTAYREIFLVTSSRFIESERASTVTELNLLLDTKDREMSWSFITYN